MYQVLARKYRPRNFNQLVGQTHVSKALTNALERNRLHHAYLFTGTRGVGKTTIARILAKCLNCETGITSTPCEICATCTAINEGRFIDLIEIDAASRTKVEDTRELLDNVPYAPTQGRYKVYLIDEVHMLSTHSFNALLKTLEEPPSHVKFLLATTDPQKLPVTVLSRCLQFTLRPLQQLEIHDHLADILAQENIGFDDKALWQLAEAAQGSVRDALSLTDQAIAYGQGRLQGSDVHDMLGLLDKDQLVHLMQAIYENNGRLVSQILQNLANQAVDLKSVLDQLISLLHQLALLQHLPQVPLQGTQEYQQQLRQLAQHIDKTDIQLYYQIALQGRQDLKISVSLQQGFDMCILRMLAFKPLLPNAQVLEAQVPESKIPELPLAETQMVQSQAINPQPLDLQAPKDSHDNNPDTQNDGLARQPHTVDESQELLQERSQSLIKATREIIVEEAPLENSLAVAADLPSNDAVDAVDAVDNQLVAQTDIKAQLEQPETPRQPSAETPIEVDAHSAVLLPQQILQHKQVALTGSWDIEKWECWLREADISPATLNLAQHGVMQGEIGGKCAFVISPEHRLMATELMEGLHQALKLQWPQGEVELLFKLIEDKLPLQLKAIRHEQALLQADHLLRQEPAIKSLIEMFGASMVNVALKS